MNRLLFAAQAKFADGETRAGRGLHRARRLRLRVYDDALEFGGERIEYEAIDEAVLISLHQLFIPSFVLRVESAGRTLRFGVNSDAFWRGELPFVVRRVRGRVRLSRAAQGLRLALLAAMAWFVWRLLS